MPDLTVPFIKTLKPFQDTTKKRMLSECAHFVLFRMGLGKTPTTVQAMWEAKPEMVLILCPKNAIRVWEDHINEWFAGLDSQLVRTTPFIIHRWRGKYNNTAKRHKMWQERVPNCMNIYIMTFGGFVADEAVLGHDFNAIVIDEAKRIRNRKSKAFDYLKPRCKIAKFFWPMTGTPGKLPMDMWTMFHLANPKVWGSYWKFVGMFHHVIKNEWGRQEILGIKNQEQWYWHVKQKASVVTREMVKDQIGKSEIFLQKLYVEMDEIQETHYKSMLEEMIIDTNDKLIIASNSMVRTLRLRQLLVCPKILSSNFTYGAAIEDFIETVRDDPHAVIFTPFVEAIPHFIERLKQEGIHAVGISGKLSADELVTTIDEFRRTRAVAICSIKFATAFSLEPADQCFFIGYEWDPDDNDQAIMRLQRLTTTWPVNAWFYVHEGTYEEEQLQLVNHKIRLNEITFDQDKVGLKF